MSYLLADLGGKTIMEEYSQTLKEILVDKNVSLLVNNVGVTQFEGLKQQTPQKLQYMVDVNSVAHVVTTQ